MTSSDIALPPWRINPDGEPRRIGVELEMSGLELDQLAAIASAFLGATVEADGRYRRRLTGYAAGEWIVEFDFNLLKKMGEQTRDPQALIDTLKGSAEGVLLRLAEPVVPLELVSPPLPMERLGEVEKLIARLREAGATGTSDRFTNAFGMQFNPEIPGTEPVALAACIKAFACLQDWLLARAEINLTRRLTAYAAPYPVDYVRLLVTPGYQPETATLIDDYLRHNPTRNRALDLMPLFAWLDEDRVRAVTDDPLIKARPTFHYRLPNCEIDRTGWGIREAWLDWLQVEYLAADADRLERCCRAYGAFLDSPLERLLGDWAKEVESRWLTEIHS